MSKTKQLLDNQETALCEYCGCEVYISECNQMPVATSPDEFEIVPWCNDCFNNYAYDRGER